MKLDLDPDRLLPADPATRNIARGLYESVADLPIVSPHSHVDPRLLLDDRPFPDAADLFIRHDHYVLRLLHAAGEPFERLGFPGAGPVADARAIWRTFCAHWELFAGTASGYWLQTTFAVEFGITEHPDAENADHLFDEIAARLTVPEFRPRALFDRFRVDVLATTDDPLDDLAVHDALAADPTFGGRVVPTFRPDAYLDPAAPGWPERITRLAAATGSPETYAGYLEGLAARRRYFVEHGAVSADHSPFRPEAVELDAADAAALFERARAGTLDAAGTRRFAAGMLFEMARMSVEDGLVMTVHPGILRNHDLPTFDRFGPDLGSDIPVPVRFAEPLAPLLRRFGNRPDFHLVLFTVDEATFSRELAPLAGYYPAVYLGVPWWFLDSPDAALRFRAAVTETAGFSRTSGFIDDTRSFLSIPVRHDMSRRVESSFLARLVREGRIDRSTADRIIVDLVADQPRRVFKL
jgi:glucuronate isomerase